MRLQLIEMAVQQQLTAVTFQSMVAMIRFFVIVHVEGCLVSLPSLRHKGIKESLQCTRN